MHLTSSILYYSDCNYLQASTASISLDMGSHHVLHASDRPPWGLNLIFSPSSVYLYCSVELGAQTKLLCARGYPISTATRMAARGLGPILGQVHQSHPAEAAEMPLVSMGTVWYFPFAFGASSSMARDEIATPATSPRRWRRPWPY